MIYNPEILVYNVSEIKNMQKKTKTTGMEGELLPENVMIKPAIRKQFEEFMRQGRVLFFSAPCGFGKTTVAETLLAGKAEEKTI